MKSLVAVICLASLIAASLSAHLVSARQGLHFAGKVAPITVAANNSTTVIGSLSSSDILARLKTLNLKPTALGGAAHFDVNHLYVNAGDYMQSLGCNVDPRPGEGIFVNSNGSVHLVHHAKPNAIVTVDFQVSNPVTNAPPTIQTSVGSATPQTWMITAPTHVVVVAVATTEGDYYFYLNGKLGVAEIKGADVWDAAQ